VEMKVCVLCAVQEEYAGFIKALKTVGGKVKICTHKVNRDFRSTNVFSVTTSIEKFVMKCSFLQTRDKLKWQHPRFFKQESHHGCS